MIDRQVLKDMGFVLGTGFDFEVWYHEYDFWVYFDDNYVSVYPYTINGNESMPDFFKKFMDYIIDQQHQ